MKKRILKIAALVIAVLLIAGVCAFANSLVGNPISKAVAERAAEKYIEKNYAGKGLEIEGVGYSFKDGYYYVYISDPDNVDGDFSLCVDMWGKVRVDNYVDLVEGGWNTAYRIRDEYRSRVDAVFESRSFPYNAYISFGEIEFISGEYKDAPGVPSYAIATDDLEGGAFYDVNEFGARAGRLTVYIDDNTVTAQRLSEILLDIRRTFDKAGVKFYIIDCVLEYPRIEDSGEEFGRVEVMDFLYSDIYEENMVERVKASNAAANDYYASEDAKREQELG